MLHLFHSAAVSNCGSPPLSAAIQPPALLPLAFRNPPVRTVLLLPSAGEEIAKCPSCSLYVRVIYDPQDFQQPAGLEA